MLLLLCLRRRRTTKVMVPSASKTATPPMAPPTIAPVCDLDDVPVVIVRFAVTWTTGALGKGQSEPQKKRPSPNTNLRASGAYIAPCAGLVGDGLINTGRRQTARCSPGSSQDSRPIRAVIFSWENACALVVRRSIVNSRYKIRA